MRLKLIWVVNSKFKEDFFVVLIISIILALIIGIVIGTKTQIVVENKINLSDCFNILVTLFVAFYLTFFLQRKIDKQKSHKDFIEKPLTSLKDLVSFFSNSSVDYNKKDVLARIIKINRVLHDCAQRHKLLKISFDIELYKSKIFEIKQIITSKSENDGTYSLNANESDKVKNISENIILCIYVTILGQDSYKR